MNFIKNLFQRKLETSRFQMPTETIDCLQFLLDAGYTPKLATSFDSHPINQLDVFRSGNKVIGDSSGLLMFPTKGVLYEVSDISPRTGFDFKPADRKRIFSLESIYHTRGGEQISLVNPNNKFDALFFALYPEMPEMTTPNTYYQHRGIFEIDKSRRVRQIN